VKVEGKDLKAGTYALFLDVETGPWNWIFSNHLGWGVSNMITRTMFYAGRDATRQE
jgi:Protein of unknown function (DUF2911)